MAQYKSNADTTKIPLTLPQAVLEIQDSDIEEVIDPYFQDPSVVKFTGGPLDGQTRRMEVYVPVIPVYSHGFHDHANNMTRAYYQNVNATAGLSEDLRQIGFVHYVFFVSGKRHP